MDQNSELMDVQEMFSQLLTTNKLKPKVAQKLSILQLSIFKNADNIDTSFFNELSEMDCQALIKLNKSAKISMFVQIVRELANQHILTPEQFFKGQIDIKTKTLGRWKTKRFEISIANKTFQIPRKKGSKKSKPNRIIELQFYSINMMIHKDTRHRFCLQALQKGKGYYKSLVCGTCDSTLYDSVVELLKKLCYFNDQNLLFGMGGDKVQIHLQKNQTSDTIQEQPNNNFLSISNPGKSSYSDIIIQNPPPLQRTSLIPLQSKTIEGTPKNLQQTIACQVHEQPDVIIKDQSEIIQERQSLSQKDIQVTTKQASHQPPQPNDAESPIIEPSPFRVSIVKSNTNPSDNDRIPQLFQKLLDDGMLTDNYLGQSFTQFNTVFNEQNIEILRSNQNPLLFRALLTLDGTDQDRVFQIFAEIEFMKKWNGNIDGDQSKFVGLIQSERSAIVYEKRRQYGMFYLPRDYVYLRNVFERDGKYYIIDKSVEHEDCPQKYKVIRGDINYQIVKIEKSPASTILISIECEITNGGFSTTEQDGQITLVYLQEIKNIREFLMTYTKQPLIQSPLLSAIQKARQKVNFKQMPAVTLIQEYPEEASQFDDDNVDEEQLYQIQSIQHRLSYMPDTGTYNVHKQDETQNEIKNLENLQKDNDEDDDEEEDVEYVPQEILSSTPQNYIAPQYREHLLRQIQSVEQETYFNNCLDYKYLNEPFDVKSQYITESEGSHFFLKQDWQRDIKNGGLLFINPKKLEAQKAVIKYMFKKIGSNLLQGKSILSITLPVTIFETRSNLERFAFAFVYAPKYLEQGAQMKSPEEQMKMTVTFGLTTILMYLSLDKPFNPIIGETYQGLIDGCPVYVEQVTHHPPTCVFQLYGRGYTMDGHIESQAIMHANSVQGRNMGFIRVTYHNTKAVQSYMMVPGYFSGTAFGDKVMNLSGSGYCIDQANQLIWEGIFNPGKASLFSKRVNPMDYFNGGIYKVKPQAIQKYKREGYTKYSGLDLSKDIVQKYSDTQGIWDEYMEIDGRQTWNLKIYPHVLSNHRNPLPSDSNYRLDILYWKLSDVNNASRVKETLEMKQRNDKKLRDKNQKRH